MTYDPYAIDHIAIVGTQVLIYTEAPKVWKPVSADLTISMSEYRRIKSLLRPKVLILGDVE